MNKDLYGLSKGWLWVKLGNLFTWTNGKGLTQKQMQPGNSKVYGGNGITGTHIAWLCEEESIVIGRVGAQCGNVHIVSPKSWITDNAIYSSWKTTYLHLKFFYYLLSFLKLNELAGGSGQPYVSQAILNPLLIPLPPLPEQHRIVAKIEEIFTELDAGVELLKKLKLKLKRYRQAVLKAAVEGNLTKEWREANQGKLEPASMLLDRILKQRREKWEGEQLAKMKAQGKTPKDDSWKLKYKEPVAPDTSDLPELPDGWCWLSFGQAFNVYVGATPSRKRLDFWEGTISWVSSGEVAFCRINKTHETITQLGLENSSTDIHPPGTILLGMIGEGKTRGQAAILNINASHNQNSAALRVSEVGMSSEYVYYFLEKEYQSTRKLGSGNNQPALNKTRVQMMVFPCPPIKEQYKIAEKLEYLFSITNQIEKTIDTNLKRAEKLRQSILKQACEGKLVPQDPNDEPAEQLLERIKGEKAKIEAEKKIKPQPKIKSNQSRKSQTTTIQLELNFDE